MVQSSVTILLDVYNHAHKCLHIAKGNGTVRYTEESKFLNKSKYYRAFITKMVSDLVYSLNYIENYTNVICIFDNKSWRKSVDIPNHEPYKSHRIPSDDVNWQLFYFAIDEFVNILSTNGVPCSNIKGAEADDLAFLWSNYLSREHSKSNCIIFSSDGDLSQLVDFDDTTFTVVYDTRSNGNKFVAKTGFKDWLKDKIQKSNEIDSDDLFNVDFLTVTENNIHETINKKILDNERFKYIELDPNEVVLNKILCGDDGDNVPSVWEWGKIKPNGKFEKRVTDSYFKKIRDYMLYSYGKIDIDDMVDNNITLNRVRVLLQEKAKILIPSDKFKEHITLNESLVRLNNKCIPDYIIDEFNTSKESLYKQSKLKSPLTNSILDNTSYKEISNIESDIFRMFK